MVNVIIKGGNFRGRKLKSYIEDTYSVWRINDSGTLRIMRKNISFEEIKKLRFKNLITESELESIKIYEKYLPHVI